MEQNEQETTTSDAEETAAETPLSQQSQQTLAEFWAAGGTFGMALRDGLAQVQQEAKAAARTSGEHIANLLYGADAVEQHTAPYTGRDYPNPNDYRDNNR